MITLFIFEAECFLRPTKKPYCLYFSLYFIFKKSSRTLSIYLYIINLSINKRFKCLHYQQSIFY